MVQAATPDMPDTTSIPHSARPGLPLAAPSDTTSTPRAQSARTLGSRAPGPERNLQNLRPPALHTARTSETGESRTPPERSVAWRGGSRRPQLQLDTSPKTPLTPA